MSIRCKYRFLFHLYPTNILFFIALSLLMNMILHLFAPCSCCRNYTNFPTLGSIKDFFFFFIMIHLSKRSKALFLFVWHNSAVSSCSVWETPHVADYMKALACVMSEHHHHSNHENHPTRCMIYSWCIFVLFFQFKSGSKKILTDFFFCKRSLTAPGLVT